MNKVDEEITYWTNKLNEERRALIELEKKVEVSNSKTFIIQDFISSLKTLKSNLEKRC